MGLSLFRAFLVINVFSIGTENPVTTKPYRFPVYPVNECPRSKDEFETAAQRRNCTKGLRYLCAPNKYLSSLIEFCTDRHKSLYQEGNCVILEGTGDLDHYSCVDKFNSTCPLEFYNDEEIYKYPACLEIDRELRCFAADNGCKKREFLTTESNLNISKMETVGNETFRGASRGWLAIGYIIATAAVLAVIILSWIIFQKRKKEQVETLLTDNQEIDDDKLRQFLSKGEITVCHVRCIIVGCAEAGKTTLLKRLPNVSFDKLVPMERTKMVDFHVNSFEVLLEEETIQSVGKEDIVPTILFSKENLEMPLKENDGKMAQRAHQPSIRKKNVSEKSSPKNTTLCQIKNIPMDILNNQANNDNAEDEKNNTFEPNSQHTTLVKNQLFPEPNEKHGEDIDANVDPNDFEQYAILKIKDVVNELMNETDLRPRITFLDFAGQSMYYAFHQIFLRPKSCSILVVDMTKGLCDKVGDQDENEQECSQFSSWRYKDYYKFWLKSIDSFSDTDSPVIIVGTHADKLSKEACHTFFNDLFDNSDLRRHLNENRVFTIGFPESGFELESLEHLKKCIANIVKCPRYSKENIRPVWALFEQILNKMKETEKVIPRKSLSDYSDQLSAKEFRIDESEISKMLDFFHRVGVLLYFDKDGLKENIILDIQWLLDAFKCIIEYPLQPEVNDMKRRHFKHTGELDNVELERIWQIQGKDFLKHKTTIIAYMEQLGLLMPLKELHSIDSTVYYFPCMNSKKFDKTGENNSKSSILCFKFDEEMQLPINGIFHGIVLKCSKLNNWSIWTERPKNNICLYQNAACFSFKKHVVVLCNCKFEIRVQVWASPEIYDRRLLKKIKHSVEDIIHDDDLSYDIGYKCRKDVLTVEEDVSFISQIIFPVSNHLCEICDVDKKHEVDNDICWEIGVNEENQVVQRKNKFTVTDKLLQNHFGCLYTELEPREIAYEMLKTDHFSTTDYHDVAALPSRYTRLKRFLEILRRNHLHVPFYDTLKSLQHELLLEALRKDQPLGHKPSHYAMCIQCSFTILIKELPNDTLQMPLLDESNLSDIEQLTSTERKKAKLLKILLLKGENACKKLYKTFSSFREGYDLKKTIEKNISDAMTTKGRPDLIPGLKDLTISCLKDSKDFLMDELVPDPISDLLFEKRAIDIFTHDKLTETNRRRQQVKYLIETVQENGNDCFQFFLFILQKQSRFICEELQNPRRRTRRDD